MIPYRMNPMGVTDPYLKRLDYLSSATNKGIYTGLTANTHKLAYEVEIEPDFTVSGSTILGNWNGTTRDMIILQFSSYIQVHVGQVGGTAGITTLYPESGVFSTIYAEADDQIPLATVKLNGTTVKSGTFDGSIITNMEMVIRIYTWKIKRWKFWQDDVLKRDFIPVLDLSWTECMYDLVEHKFYYMR